MRSMKGRKPSNGTRPKLNSELLKHGVEHIVSAALAAQVGRQHLTLANDLVDRAVDTVGGSSVAEMTQHERSGADRRNGVRDTLTLDVGRRSVDTVGESFINICM